jgi:transposase
MEVYNKLIGQLIEGKTMSSSWQNDGRKIPDEVMSYIRQIAVRAVEEKGYSPEDVIKILGLSRSCIYEWLRKYREEGFTGLETQMAPGATPVITKEMDVWLRETVLQTTPEEHGYDTRLWNRDILAELLYQHFGVWVRGRTISRHLKKMKLSYQKPCYRATEQDPEEVRHFLEDKFPRIQRLAQKMGAEIGFEDEAGVRISTRHGRTWGERGKTPEVLATDQRDGYNMLSIVSAAGTLRYHVTGEHIHSEQFIAFLKQLLKARKCPLILLLDRASFHKSKAVRDFVRAHRKQIRIFFLPRHAPEYNPDEQVWDEIKVHRIGKQPVKNKRDLKRRIYSTLTALQRCIQRIQSFFQLPETQYAA